MLGNIRLAARWLREVSRWDEWATSKIPLLLACICYAMLIQPVGSTPELAKATQLVLAFCLYAMFGYMANAWSDRAIDLLAGKSSSMSRIGPVLSGSLVTIVLVCGIGLIAACYNDRLDILVLFAFSYVLAAAYSLPPVRLKERGLSGMLASAIAQRALPAVIVFQTFSAWDPAAVVLCWLNGMVGLRYIVVHQLQDAAVDRATGVRTVATVRGSEWLKYLHIRVFFPLEIIALLMWLAMTLPNWSLLGCSAILYLMSSIIRYLHPAGEGAKWMHPVSYRVFSEYYNLFLPLVAALVLAAVHPGLWLIPLFTLIWLIGDLHDQYRLARQMFDIRR